MAFPTKRASFTSDDVEAPTQTIEKDPTTYLDVLKCAFDKHYSEQSDVWTNDPEMRSFPALIQGLLKLDPACSVLDIGCGSGQDVEYFAQLFSSATGLDLYPHHYWQIVSQRHSNAIFHRADFLSYFCDQKYDLIVDNGCFHHQHPEHQSAYLKKITCLLNKDGYFALSTFKNPNIEERVDANGRLHKYFSDADLLNILSSVGFQLVHQFDIYRARKKDYYRLSFCEFV